MVGALHLDFHGSDFDWSIMSTVCSQCGGTDIEYDQARGDAVCTSCGSVLEDNIIVSEVTFVEQSCGSSSVIGQFVSAEGQSSVKCSKQPLSGSGFHHGLGKDSREITLQQAKKRLNNLGHLLKLNQHCIDSAFMFFKMALQMNLTRGRKSSIIDTACLYLVCRSEGTPHLLLDFSDVLQINVYALGRAYLRLSNALHINPPAIDPCLYIHRFAHKLELGEKTHEVSMTALRLVARMKRDWIHHGRRPAGLCGAALLVSARLHNFNRSVREVARVVKLSEGTLRKRLGDFKDTPSSRLTIDEFLKIDLEQEHDPPSFTESKRKSKQLGLPQEGDTDEQEEVESEEEEGERGFRGIKMESVGEVIAKARFNESYLHVNLGLDENLEELAKHFESEENDGEDREVEPGSSGELDLSGIDDDEIDKLLLSDDEVKIKTQLWFAENGDYLKEQEVRRAKLAAIKAEKDKEKKSRRQRTRKTKAQASPAMSAGEAIERMLVERKISTKINYDVLRDLANGLAKEEGPSHHSSPSNNATADNLLTISKSPPSSAGRLPSLNTRKRNFSALMAESGTSSQPPVKCGRTSLSTSTTIEDLLHTDVGMEQSSIYGAVREGERQLTEGGEQLIEETGPVDYCLQEEGEGVDVEQLVYEGDPLLLHSDYEEEDEGGYSENFDDY